MSKPLAIVAGAGPGLGQALVSYLNDNGYTAVGLNRTVPPGTASTTLACDLTDADETARAIRELVSTHASPKVVIHNPARLIIAPFEETTTEDFEATWRAMVLSATHLARAVLPGMVGNRGGTFIVSGATASLRGGANFSAFSSAKAGLRALTQSLAREYGPKGIHVAHVILDGILDTGASHALHKLDAGRMMLLEDVAAAYVSLAQQPTSTWTHELDLRPMGESF
jgi:NAD(P)-dependent dehydrogenase (short-subunit alcohol dehydrogenase family)